MWCRKFISCPLKEKIKLQSKNVHPVLILLILTSSLNNVLPGIKQSLVIDLSVKVPVAGNSRCSCGLSRWFRFVFLL